MAGEAFVDVTYRGLEVGRRLKLWDVGPSTAYVEVSTPMPVGAEVVIQLDERVSVPTGIANFHHTFAPEGKLPREWAERIHPVARFTDMPRGGHFAAVEAPELLATEIAAFFGG